MTRRELSMRQFRAAGMQVVQENQRAADARLPRNRTDPEPEASAPEAWTQPSERGGVSPPSLRQWVSRGHPCG